MNQNGIFGKIKENHKGVSKLKCSPRNMTRSEYLYNVHMDGHYISSDSIMYH